MKVPAPAAVPVEAVAAEQEAISLLLNKVGTAVARSLTPGGVFSHVAEGVELSVKRVSQDSPRTGAQFTCFTSTKVKILTRQPGEQVLSVLALRVQTWKY